MGFIPEDLPGHEGYAVAYVARDGIDLRGREDPGLYRELMYPRDAETVPSTAIYRIGAACECGWRSGYLLPDLFGKPKYPHWYPYSLEVSERDDERVRRLWREHTDERLARLKEAQRRASAEHPWRAGGDSNGR